MISLFGVLCIVFGIVVVSGWWMSMFVASTLCRDSITEIIQDVRTTAPVDRSNDSGEDNWWVATVAKPALSLRHSLDKLSRGWSTGLVGVAGSMLLQGLSWFTLAINTEFCTGLDQARGQPVGTVAGSNLVLAVLFPSLSLLLAFDIAYTSTRCNLLMSELNATRIKHGPASHSTISWLAISLQQLVRLCVGCFCLRLHGFSSWFHLPLPHATSFVLTDQNLIRPQRARVAHRTMAKGWELW